MVSAGFRSKRSCETQLLEFITDVAKDLKDRKQTDTLIMDFSKALDEFFVHARLIEKLKFYGITGETKAWFPYSRRCRKAAGGSLLPSSICHAPGTAVERFKWKRLNIVLQPSRG